MRVLVTGGTGFIGSRLAAHSREQGHDVCVLGQTNTQSERENLQWLRDSGIKYIACSVTDRDAVHRAVAGCDVVFHLAAAQHEANVPEHHFWQVNVEGTRNVLDAAEATGVQRLVHGSSIGVYGAAISGAIDETTPLRPDNIYGITKQAGEELVHTYRDRVPVATVRISETYGPGDRRLLKLFKAISKGMFFMIGPGDNQHQLIYVDDLVRGLWATATQDSALGEVFILAGSETVDTNGMARAIANAVSTPIRPWRAPLWPFLVAAVILEKTLSPLGIQPPIHRRRMDFFRKSFFFSQDKANRLLSFRAEVPFEVGAKRTAQWYVAQGLL